MADTKKTIAEKPQTIRYTKEQLMQSRKFMENRDLLNALLHSNKNYSIEEVESILLKYKKGKVK